MRKFVDVKALRLKYLYACRVMVVQLDPSAGARGPYGETRFCGALILAEGGTRPGSVRFSNMPPRSIRIRYDIVKVALSGSSLGLLQFRIGFSIARHLSSQHTSGTLDTRDQDVSLTPPSSERTSALSSLSTVLAPASVPKILSTRLSRSQTVSRAPPSPILLKYRMRCCGIHSSSVLSEIQFFAGISLIPSNLSR